MTDTVQMMELNQQFNLFIYLSVCRTLCSFYKSGISALISGSVNRKYTFLSIILTTFMVHITSFASYSDYFWTYVAFNLIF